jgi:hypothetical protein
MSNNIVVLQGYFEPAGPPERVDLGNSTQVLLLRAWVYTGEVSLGGRHSVWLTDKSAEYALAKARDWTDAGSRRLPQVFVEGDLFSTEDKAYVRARVVRFLDIPQATSEYATGRLRNTEPNSPTGCFELAGAILADGDWIGMILDEQWVAGMVALISDRYVFLPSDREELIPLASGTLARRPAQRGGVL